MIALKRVTVFFSQMITFILIILYFGLWYIHIPTVLKRLILLSVFQLYNITYV